ncbi:MAG TPA: class F sortase [Kineosporiaceae bacterium]|nr:class F sortase [Kineosporiaceae bacterium]
MRGPVLLAVAMTVAAALAGCGGTHATPISASRAAATTSRGATPSSTTDHAAGFRSPRTHPTVAPPARLRIPAIGVDTPLLRLGLDATGAVEPPKPWMKAGWFTGSARPGQAGPAVILGHVDSTTGPAVFYRLASLRPGDTVQVTRTDGTRITFRVSGRQQVAKSQFPTDLVYGPSLEPSLRLVTCGGSFDKRAGHYRDNIIVSAVPA